MEERRNTERFPLEKSKGLRHFGRITYIFNLAMT
jgi:hypothetical protein